MKKVKRITSLVVLIFVLSMSFAFAGDFTFEGAYPSDGQTGVALENFGVKLTFSSEFSEEILKDSNDNCFKLVGPYKGKDIDEENYSFPLKVLYADGNEILVLIDKAEDGSIVILQGASEYTLTISGSLKDNNGKELGQDQTVHFTTLNQQRNNMVNTFMMFGMFGVIILVTMRSQKKATEKEKTKNKGKKEENVNPYKVAKKTGKSVEQVVQETDKKKAKKEAKEKKNEKIVNSNILYLESDEYYVTTLRAIPEDKSEFVRAYKEEKALRREELKKKKQAAKAQKKGKKK